jgi:hypothetical protein
VSVRRFSPRGTGWDVVHIEIDDLPWPHRDPRLLDRLAGRGGHGPFRPLDVPTGLEPTPERDMIDQEQAPTVRREDKRGRRQVTG